MSKSLPVSPSLKHLRNEAKQIHGAHGDGNVSCCAVLRNLNQFKGFSDQEILKAKITLQEVQLALAIEYGFESWTALKSYVSGEEKRSTDATVLRGLSWVPRATSHMGCLEACAKYLGIELTAPWLYGGTGHAFFMHVNPVLCPSSPHSWDHLVEIPLLAENLGLAITVVRACPWEENEETFPKKQAEVWEFVRKSIDRGTPCYGWHYEFIVIGGYDNDGYLLSGPVEAPRTHPRGYHAFSSWRDFGATAGPRSVEIAVVNKGPVAEDRKVVREGLLFAVRAAGTEGLGKGAYDTWLEYMRAPKEDGGFGAAYNAGVYSECRKFAHRFLEEASSRLDGDCGPLFASAIQEYKAVADAMEAVAREFPFLDGKRTAEMNANLADSERRMRAIDALAKAKESESRGVHILETIASKLS